MPEEFIEAELWPLFGGREETLRAPYDKVQRHMLRIRAKWNVTVEVNDEMRARQAEHEREMQRMMQQGRR